ncbi:glycoside hydrolase family 3 N-terminal domain-containing protein [Arthrobacter sp.]|uniref:glycoside hydrolase family 3 N-terminal domain-containing protein n=1 Tax=Arthrobacter sp. TaxID=1667 RepID=UPI0028124770|nr:glycoside hydrolase family 3 N-terminal domain-containing protein [Arthrobacter sp.]
MIFATVLLAAACTPGSTGGTPSPSGSSPAPRVSASPSAQESTTAAPPSATNSPDAGGEQLGWGPGQKDLDAARTAVSAMTVSQKAGQVLLPFYQGLDHAAQAAAIERLHLAGSIVMADNVPGTPDGQVDTAAMGRVTADLQKATTADGRKWPGMIAVDQEGGLVSRLRTPLTEWPSPMSYGAAGKPSLASDAGRLLAGELVGLGFNVDFAPDADVTIGPADPTIGSRSMSGSPETVGQMSVGFFQGMLAAGVLPAIKHFPGHGSVTVDSHLDLPVQPAPTAQLEARDWVPFKAGIAAGVPMVMTAHIAVPALEPDVPASVSKATYSVLRGIGFKGVAVTDALNMGAIQKQFPGGSAAPKALAAGADLLLMPPDVEAAHQAIVAAVGNGSLAKERLDEAAQRVVTMMLWRGRTAIPPAPAPGSGADLSRKLSATAITVLSGPCRGPIIQGSVTVAGGSPADRARFAKAAANVGVTIGTGPTVSLIGFGEGPVKADVAVSLDAPWSLASSAAATRIALYGRTPGAFDALLAVLIGKAGAPGKLPVDVGSYPRGSGCP